MKWPVWQPVTLGDDDHGFFVNIDLLSWGLSLGVVPPCEDCDHSWTLHVQVLCVHVTWEFRRRKHRWED